MVDLKLPNCKEKLNNKTKLPAKDFLHDSYKIIFSNCTAMEEVYFMSVQLRHQINVTIADIIYVDYITIMTYYRYYNDIYTTYLSCHTVDTNDVEYKHVVNRSAMVTVVK